MVHSIVTCYKNGFIGLVNSLNLLYTYNLQGDLALLPRLYTAMQRIKPDPRPLIVDLGASCVPDVWPCDVTGGRSTLVILDGMGYHAANVQGLLTADARHQLHGVISTVLVDESQSWRYHVPPVRDEGILIAVTPVPTLRLCIVLQPAAQTHIDQNTLYLAAVEKGQIGSVTLDLTAAPTITAHTVYDVPPDAKPDPTIAAAVEFVQEEARYFQRRLQHPPDDT